MFDKSTRSKQVCQLLLSLIVAMITVHFNYAKLRFDILKLLSM